MTTELVAKLAKSKKASPVKSESGRMTVAEYLTAQIALSGKQQSQIAEEAGFTGNASILSIFKQGTSKVPVARVGRLAKALGVDPLYFYQLVMSEYEPETWKELQDTVFKQPLLTDNEKAILDVIRSANVKNPRLRTVQEKAKLTDFINTLYSENDQPNA